MPYIYITTTDEILIKLYKNFEKASQEAFNGTESQRFESILQAQDFRNKLDEYLLKTNEKSKIKLIDQNLIEDEKNEESVIDRLAALLFDEPDLKAFIKRYKDKLGNNLKALFNEILSDIPKKGYVLFWMVSEEEFDEML